MMMSMFWAHERGAIKNRRQSVESPVKQRVNPLQCIEVMSLFKVPPIPELVMQDDRPITDDCKVKDLPSTTNTNASPII